MSEEAKPEPVVPVVPQTAGDSAEPQAPSYVTIDDFMKIRLVTALVVSAAEVPKSNKLLILQLQIGDPANGEVYKKQIVAGIKQHYSAFPSQPDTNDAAAMIYWKDFGSAKNPENKPCIVGKTIIIVNNLKPSKVFGVDSYGMLLAVKSPSGELRLLTTDGPAQSGLSVG